MIIIGAEGWDGTVTNNDLRCVSASSIGKVFASGQLERWAIGATIDAAVNHSQWIADSVRQGQHDAAKSYLWRARYDSPFGFTNAKAGTAVHAWLEWGLLGRAIPPELNEILAHPTVVQMCLRLRELVERIDLRIEQMEHVVFDPSLQVAGRFDMKGSVNVCLGPGLIDLKTALEPRSKRGHPKRPYADSHALQLASLAGAPLEATFPPRIVKLDNDRGRVYLLNETEAAACRPATPVQWAAILHVSPERASFWPVDISSARPVVAAAVTAHDWLSSGAAKALPKQPLAVVDSTTPTQEAA